jgi:hypothetical protein
MLDRLRLVINSGSDSNSKPDTVERAAPDTESVAVFRADTDTVANGGADSDSVGYRGSHTDTDTYANSQLIGKLRLSVVAARYYHFPVQQYETGLEFERNRSDTIEYQR